MTADAAVGAATSGAADADAAGGAQLPEPASASTQDALDLLHDDHRRIEALLADCERLAGGGTPSAADASGAVSRLGALLIAHAQMEQQLFYPAIGLPPPALAQALAEHAAVEERVHALNAPEFDAAAFGAGVSALAAEVRAHLGQEEDALFAQARASGVDLQALGTQLALRRGELLGHQGVD